MNNEKIDQSFHLIVSDNIVLRSPREEHADEIFALVEKNRIHLREFLGWVDAAKNVKDIEQFLLGQITKNKQLKGMLLEIFYQDQLAGLIDLHHIDFFNNIACVGYWLDKKFERKGIMTQSLAKLIEYAFTKLKLNRIELRCAVTNERSCKLAKRLNFVEEGRLKSAIWHYGKYFDTILYGLVKRD